MSCRGDRRESVPRDVRSSLKSRHRLPQAHAKAGAPRTHKSFFSFP